jgi:hypothetical protein
MSDVALMVQEEAPVKRESLNDIVRRMVDLFEISESTEDEGERAFALAEIDTIFSTDLPKKADGICWFLGHCESEMQYAGRVIAQLQTAIERHEARQKRVRDLTKQAMQAAGIRRIQGTWQALSLRAGSDSVEIMSTADLPLEYCRITAPQLSPDKPAIKRAIKAGEEVPGARLHTGAETLMVK